MLFRRLALALALACVVAWPAIAVGPTGTIVGTVADPSEAVIPKAQITVRNQETNATREVLTNNDGDFSVPLLPPGVYEVSAEKAGFRRAFYGNVNLNVDQTVRVDFVLQVGRPSEQVIVTESIPLVQTDTSTLGQVIERKQVGELPLNERNFLTFALLVPGGQLPVQGSQNSTQGGAISVNGAREQSNDFLLDGVDNNDLYINQYSVLPSVDAIQEFKVQSSDYSAEFGRSSGAQVNVVLKSGTNQFHGSGFEFVRNRQMDAKNFFDQPDCTPDSILGTCAPIPRLDRNQFGGTLGGPIQKDKTFFFVSYEGLRLRQATTREANVPSQVELAEATGFANLLGYVGFPQNPAGMAALNLIPAANVAMPDLADSTTYVASPVIQDSYDLLTIKLDRQTGSNNTFSGHYSLFNENRFNPFDPVNAFTALPGYGSSTINRGQNAGFTWTHVFSSHWVNEARLGFNRLRGAAFQQDYGINVTQQLGFPTVSTNPVDWGYPNVNLYGFDGLGEPVNYPQDRHDNTYEFADNLAWNTGRHQFKFGTDIRRFQLNSYLDFLSRGDWFFDGYVAQGIEQVLPPPLPNICPGGLADCPQQIGALAQLITGVPDYVVTETGNTSNGLRTTGLGAYVQDDIRVLPRFTLNVGLRWEFNSPPIEIHNRFSVPDLSANPATCSPLSSAYPNCAFIQAGTGGIPRATYGKNLHDFAPRIGIAWRPLKTERFVVRSAYGIFYDENILNLNILPRFNPPFVDISALVNSTGTSVIQNILSQQGQPEPQANFVSRNFRDAYMQDWNVDLQYEVQPNWMIDLAYVGTRGTHLPATRDMNELNPFTQATPYQQFGSILVVEPRANSIYNALQFRSEKRVRQGLAFLAAYTWSRSIDDDSAVFSGSVSSGVPQNSYDFRADRGLSDFQVEHRIVFSYLYDLPLGAGRKWLNNPGIINRIFGSWQTAGIATMQTGSPFTISMPASQAGTSISSFGVPYRPDLVGDPNKAGPVAANPGCSAPAQIHTPNGWFNPCAFAQPSIPGPNVPGAFGTAGRNILIGPGLNNLDFSLLKDIPFRHEGRRLQFRFEFFNLFNIPHFDIPGRTFGESSLGLVQSSNVYGSRPPRQIQLGLKYIF
ncbi:MAG: TonB-dependent receptor [Terriglobia bacterium]|jgi:hypothetical protein